MKRKNAFTLIELLAIIVILAIIAVITVPIILNIIEDSKRGAAIDSAYGYKNAISKYYALQMIDNTNLKLDGVYSVDEGILDKAGEAPIQVPVSGTLPKVGWIKISENEVTNGCLTIDEYKIELKDGKFITNGKGDCPEGPLKAFKREVGKTGDLEVGELVSIGEEGNEQYFYVVNPDGEENTVILLSRFNLNVGNNKNLAVEDGLQHETVFGYGNSTKYGNVAFSETNYWVDNNSYLKSEIYGESYPAEVYDENCYLYTYIEDYVDELSSMGNFEGTIEGRLLTYSEAEEFKVDNDEKLYETSFWLGTATSSGYVWYAITSGYLSSDYYDYAHFYGVRPVIVISKSDI